MKMIKELFRKYMARLYKEKMFNKKNIEGPVEEHFSPSGKYKLLITRYNAGKGYWSYSRGQVFNNTTKKIIADVKRNYSVFPFSWTESHPNGHDYLICGEDYQGQTVIELDTKQRNDYLPKEASHGCGFCYASHESSPNKKYLVVDGCYWGAPYQIKVFDFSDPLNLPYRETFDSCDFPTIEKVKWIADDEIQIIYEEEVRMLDKKLTRDLSDEEYNELKPEDITYQLATKTVKVQ